MVGTSGADGKRFAPVEAMRRARPSFTNGRMLPGTRNEALTWPPTRSVTAGPEPLYGTCVTSMCAALFSISIVRCEALPMDTEAYASLPGCALASFTNSATLCAGTLGCTARNCGDVTA